MSRGHVLTSTYTFFSAMTCVHRRVLHALLAGKIAQMYPERRRLATSPRAPEKPPPQGDTQERAPSRRTQNQPDRSPSQEPRDSAGDSVNRVRLGPPGGGPGGVRLLWGGVPAEISAARLSGLVVVVSPGTSDCCGRRRPRARCAEGPAASVCQLDAQVSAQAALQLSSRAFSGASLSPARTAREPPGDGTSAAHSEALALPTRRSLGHLPTCWSFAK